MDTQDKSKVNWLKINKDRAIIKMSSGNAFVLWDESYKPFSQNRDLYRLWISQLEIAIERHFNVTVFCASSTDATITSVILWDN